MNTDDFIGAVRDLEHVASIAWQDAGKPLNRAIYFTWRGDDRWDIVAFNNQPNKHIIFLRVGLGHNHVLFFTTIK